MFASVVSGPIEIFFNAKDTAAKEYPACAGKPIGATGTMFIEMANVEDLHERLKARVPMITFAERVAADPASA